MKYVIYYTWKDGQKDSDNVSNRKQLDLFLADLLRRKDEFQEVCYCKIYSNGEYGIEHYLLTVDNRTAEKKAIDERNYKRMYEISAQYYR